MRGRGGAACWARTTSPRFQAVGSDVASTQRTLTRCDVVDVPRRRAGRPRGDRDPRSRAAASCATWCASWPGRSSQVGSGRREPGVAAAPCSPRATAARGRARTAAGAHGPHASSARPTTNPLENPALPAGSGLTRRPPPVPIAAPDSGPSGVREGEPRAWASRPTRRPRACDPQDVVRRWYVVDATDKVLGRLATRDRHRAARQAPAALHAARRHGRLRDRRERREDQAHRPQARAEDLHPAHRLDRAPEADHGRQAALAVPTPTA